MLEIIRRNADIQIYINYKTAYKGDLAAAGKAWIYAVLFCAGKEPSVQIPL